MARLFLKIEMIFSDNYFGSYFTDDRSAELCEILVFNEYKNIKSEY